MNQINQLNSLTYPLDVFKLGALDHVTTEDFERANGNVEMTTNLNALMDAEWHVMTVRRLVNGMLQALDEQQDPYTIIGQNIPEESSLKERFEFAVHDSLDILENIHQMDWPAYGFVLPASAFA